MTSLIKRNASGPAGDGDADLLVDEVVGVPGASAQPPGGSGPRRSTRWLRRAAAGAAARGGAGRRRRPGPAAVRPVQRPRPGAAARRGARHRRVGRLGSGTRSGTPACGSTTPCAPSPRRSRWPRTTSRSPSGCSTPGYVAGDPALADALIARRRRPVAAHRRPAPARPAGGHRQPAGRPTASWPSCWRATSRRPPAVCATCGCCGHRRRRDHRRAAPRRTRRPPAAAGHPRRPAPGRSAAGSTGWSPRSATDVADAARARRRRRAAAPGRRRRPHDQPRPRRRLAGRRPAALRPPPRRPTAARPRRPVARDVVEQDGELVLARTAIGARPDPSLSLRVAAAAATTRAADRPGHLRVAGRVLPAAARALAGRRPGRADHPARRRSRPGARPGRPATGTGWSTAGCPSGPGCAACRSTTRCTGSPSTGTWCRPRTRPAGTPARWTGPTCCCSARSCTTSARGCPATTAPSARRSPPAVADPDRSARRRGRR